MEAEVSYHRTVENNLFDYKFVFTDVKNAGGWGSIVFDINNSTYTWFNISKNLLMGLVGAMNNSLKEVADNSNNIKFSAFDKADENMLFFYQIWMFTRMGLI